MIRFTLILIGIFAISNAVGAIDDEHITIEQIYDMAQNVLNATEKWQQDLEHYSVEGRKSKFFPFGLLPFHALWGFGGLNALAVLFAIKFKIIIIASVIAFSVYYYTKFVAVKKCSGSLYRDGAVYPADASYSGSTFYSSPITAYSSPFAGDISSHNLEHYSSIHDSTVHSDAPSYSFDHGPHDLDHEHHEFEHHSSDFDHYIPDTHDISSGGGEMMSGESKNSASGSVPSMSATYRRVGKHRRRRANKQQIE